MRCLLAIAYCFAEKVTVQQLPTFTTTSQCYSETKQRFCRDTANGKARFHTSLTEEENSSDLQLHSSVAYITG